MNVRSSNDVSCYPAPSEVDSNYGNPCSLVGNSLFPKSGNTPGGAPKSDPITEAASPGSPNSVYFPVFSLQIRDLRPKTSSLQTARSATQSAVAETSRLHPGTDREIRAIPRGFGGRALAHPNQRRRFRSLEGAVARGFLCWQVGRFGFAFDSPQ